MNYSNYSNLETSNKAIEIISLIDSKFNKHKLDWRIGLHNRYCLLYRIDYICVNHILQIEVRPDGSLTFWNEKTLTHDPYSLEEAIKFIAKETTFANFR